MNKFFLYYSGLSALLYISGSIVFFNVFKNIQGGLWANAAAFIAAKCFFLHCLYFSDKLHMYYKEKHLKHLTTASFVIVLIASVFLIWYTFTAVYWKVPFFDWNQTPLFSLVFCFLVGKWGLHMYATAKEYSGYLTEDYSPIAQAV